jgi:hypothetical protein
MPDSQDNIVGPPDLGWTVTTLKMHFDAILIDRQRQHQQSRQYYDGQLAAAAQERQTIREHYDKLILEFDRRYLDRFAAIEQNVTTAFLAQEKAINKADIANEKRFDSVNEFRGQQGDMQRTLMPRAEAEALFKSMNETMVALSKSMNDKIDSLTIRVGAREAMGTGQQQVWGYVAAIIGVVVGLAGIVLALLR